nr:MAG TPA: hypothetical protein [Bacteriophage sp.]
MRAHRMYKSKPFRSRKGAVWISPTFSAARR